MAGEGKFALLATLPGIVGAVAALMAAITGVYTATQGHLPFAASVSPSVSPSTTPSQTPSTTPSGSPSAGPSHSPSLSARVPVPVVSSSRSATPATVVPPPVVTTAAPTQSPSSPPTPSASPPPAALAAAADPIAGGWSGQSSDGSGGSFTITLLVAKGCGLGTGKCGSISVANTPCAGDIRLNSVSGQTFEFYVYNFDPARSNMTKCQEGPGDSFTLQGDGTLYYTTNYGMGPGTLRKNG